MSVHKLSAKYLHLNTFIHARTTETEITKESEEKTNKRQEKRKQWKKLRK
jgi:hypothetical protein